MMGASLTISPPLLRRRLVVEATCEACGELHRDSVITLQSAGEMTRIVLRCPCGTVDGVNAELRRLDS